MRIDSVILKITLYEIHEHFCVKHFLAHFTVKHPSSHSESSESIPTRYIYSDGKSPCYEWGFIHYFYGKIHHVQLTLYDRIQNSETHDGCSFHSWTIPFCEFLLVHSCSFIPYIVHWQFIHSEIAEFVRDISIIKFHSSWTIPGGAPQFLSWCIDHSKYRDISTYKP